MEVVVEGQTNNAVEKIRNDAKKTVKYQSISAGKTPLEAKLTDIRKNWLTEYVCERFRILHDGLRTWRTKMEIWERMSNDDYSDRITEPNPEKPDITPDIFRVQNGSMGLTAGFADFATAQAKNDIFGTYPWMAANPEGKSDRDLSNLITKHSQWKFNQTNLEEVLLDGIRVACWGGTAFVKPRWETQVEKYHTVANAAWSKRGNGFIMGPNGDFVQDKETLEQMQNKGQPIDGSDIEWRERYVENSQIVYNNLRTSLLDFRDVAFDEKAPELNLNFTDFFTRFRVGLLDAVETYGIPEEKIGDLRSALVSTDEEVRPEDGETSSTTKMPGYEDDDANPTITLVEGFVRINVLGGNTPPARIHVVFSQDLRMLFKADYLANVTPSGILPVFPIRAHKKPRRIFGRGYFEKFKEDNDAVDRHHNTVTHKNHLQSTVITCIQPDALLDESEGKDGLLDISKPLVLKSGKTAADLISFAVMPQLNGTSDQLLNQRMQMAQMKSGITSAAQGELKGVPTASTATGVMQMQSRGALLQKEQVDKISADIEKCVEYCVHLNYANLDQEEVFTWGEAGDSQLFRIKPGDVQGLRMNVSLTMVQAQNQAKFQSAQAGIDVVMKYVGLPEHEKESARMLFIEALTMLGFNEAQDIIRQPIVDPASLLALLPPEQAAQVQAAFIQSGLIALPSPVTDAPDAPVTQPEI